MSTTSNLVEPAPELVLTEVAQLKALGDALRLRLIEIMAAEPRRTWVAKELAAQLGTKQTKLYHHLALLADAGILRVADTRMVSGIQEKRYQVSARSFRVDRRLVTGSHADAGIGTVLDAMFERARADIVESVRAGLIRLDDPDRNRRNMALRLARARLGPAGVRKVMRLIEKLSAFDREEHPEGQDYGLVVGFYPCLTTPEKGE